MSSLSSQIATLTQKIETQDEKIQKLEHNIKRTRVSLVSSSRLEYRWNSIVLLGSVGTSAEPASRQYRREVLWRI